MELEHLLPLESTETFKTPSYTVYDKSSGIDSPREPNLEVKSTSENSKTADIPQYNYSRM